MEENYYQHKSGFSRRDFIKTSAILSFSVMAWPGNSIFAAPGRQLRAGASAVDTTPTKFPIVCNGGWHPGYANKVNDPLYARCLVLDDGKNRVALVVVDICVMHRELIDEAKRIAERKTGIPTDRIMVSATHTHSAPSAMPCLGVEADKPYQRFLIERIAESVDKALKNLAAARVGWAVADDFQFNYSRRWILRSDCERPTPIGDHKDRAQMCPGYQNAQAVGPSGPVDPALSMLAVQSATGKPLALFANYSMHYYGWSRVSSDYCGLFCRKIKKMIGGDSSESFTPIISQGTSGDLQYWDYSKPPRKRNMDAYVQALANVAYRTYQKIQYHDWVPVSMLERKLTLRRRVPDEKRLAWAKQVMKNFKGKTPTGVPNILAREQIYLHNEPERELKLQAIRIGELGITAIPNEVYGITGLKLKAQSPLTPTFNVGLANGEDGYIPPPEQHKLGGYTTWEARTAGLEEQAEPKIVENLLQMFEQITDKPRRKLIDPQGPYVKSVLAMKPLAYWRMSEFSGPEAVDISGNGNHATYEDYIAFYLPGPDRPNFSGEKVNRAAHFAGGRVRADIRQLNDNYTVNMWIWNGFPTDARDVTGYIFSRGPDGGKGDCLGIGGKGKCQGKLFFAAADGTIIEGTTKIPMKTWQHMVLMRDGEKLAIFLEGTVEISATLKTSSTNSQSQIFIGGSSENKFNFEGKIDEVALFNRPLKPDETA